MAQRRSVEVGGLRLAVADAGAGGRPLVLLHGFPELGRSWRHQMRPLAAAGWHVVVPDLRGFGGSDAPQGVDCYDALTVGEDIVGLMSSFGHERFVAVGHDWGASLAWTLALTRPDQVEAVAGLSVPALPRAPAPPLALLRQFAGEDFYVVWFQEPGVADEALARDVRRTLRATEQWTAAWAEREDDKPRPAFWSPEDEDAYVAEFERTGFTGGLNYYRAMDRTWERLEPWAEARIEQPALFLTGSRDPVKRFMPAAAMDGLVTDVRREEIEGAGHWLQQERPDEVNAILLDWLRGLPDS